MQTLLLCTGQRAAQRAGPAISPFPPVLNPTAPPVRFRPQRTGEQNHRKAAERHRHRLAGQGIWTDQYGRVKVQFGWDRYGKWMKTAPAGYVSYPWRARRDDPDPAYRPKALVGFQNGDPVDLADHRGRTYNQTPCRRGDRWNGVAERGSFQPLAVWRGQRTATCAAF